MKTLLLIALGGALGSVARHGVNQISLRFLGSDFPWGTLGVNVLGSLLIGCLAGYFAHISHWPQEVRTFCIVGFLGGFTTFSAFSLDGILLWERGAVFQMFAYVTASVVLSLLATVAGLYLIRSFSA
jgi:CrcB protein